MGWDAFGLPAENYAIKMGVHPAISTAENVKHIKEQINQIAALYDWDREVKHHGSGFLQVDPVDFREDVQGGPGLREGVPHQLVSFL